MNEQELRNEIMSNGSRGSKLHMTDEQRRLHYPLLYPFDQDYEDDDDDDETI
jgi:hypothetical protein